jgi:hypothetical protein
LGAAFLATAFLRLGAAFLVATMIFSYRNDPLCNRICSVTEPAIKSLKVH